MANENLVMSPVGLALTQASEGLRLVAYADPRTGGAPWTLGYGHTAGVREGDTCTQEQAMRWLVGELAGAAEIVKAHVVVALDQGQGDALIDFTFNMGAGRPAGVLGANDPGKDGFVVLANGNPSSLLRLVNDGDFKNAALEFEKWDVGGPPGLRVRHSRQRQLFTTGTWS